MGVVGVNHIGVSVRDLAAARAFWSAVGFAELAGFAWGPGTTPADEALGIEGTAAEVAILVATTSYLELFRFDAPQPAQRPADSPGIAGVTVGVRDLAGTVDSLRSLGGEVAVQDDARAATTSCPDGTPVRLEGSPAPGLSRVAVRVVDPAGHPLAVPPDAVVAYDAVPGGGRAPARPCDLGANHVCLDVEGIAEVRAGLDGAVRWHHGITASSGGIASVCYGTTVDGLVVELLESHSPDAALTRARLTGA